MGSLVIEALASAPDIDLVAGVESPDHPAIRAGNTDIPFYPDGVKLPEADVWLDFSLAEPAMHHAAQSAEKQVPLVIAATGFKASDNDRLKHHADLCPILLAPNLSIGIAALDRIAGNAAEILGNEFDSAILEIHHNTKVDKPSGTALRLAETLNSEGLKPEISSLRIGGAIGEHRVYFTGSDEELIITHRAFSRKAFSRGATRAIRFIHEKETGLYTIQDMFREE